MREIKFRAWDKNGQVMLQVGDKYGTTHPLDCCNYALQGQNITLMQYTGLKDKNGKEIYEGDRVSLAGLNGTVVWDNTMARFVLKSDGKQIVKYQTISQMTKSQMSIIGNIYEN